MYTNKGIFHGSRVASIMDPVIIWASYDDMGADLRSSYILQKPISLQEQVVIGMQLRLMLFDTLSPEP